MTRRITIRISPYRPSVTGDILISLVLATLLYLVSGFLMHLAERIF